MTGIERIQQKRNEFAEKQRQLSLTKLNKKSTKPKQPPIEIPIPGVVKVCTSVSLPCLTLIPALKLEKPTLLIVDSPSILTPENKDLLYKEETSLRKERQKVISFFINKFDLLASKLKAKKQIENQQRLKIEEQNKLFGNAIVDVIKLGLEDKAKPPINLTKVLTSILKMDTGIKVSRTTKFFCEKLDRLSKKIAKKIEEERPFNPETKKGRWLIYRRLVNDLTKRQPWQTLPDAEKRNYFSFQLDHKVSTIYGFRNGILPALIADISNLRIIYAEENRKKNGKPYFDESTKYLHPDNIEDIDCWGVK